MPDSLPVAEHPRTGARGSDGTEALTRRWPWLRIAIPMALALLLAALPLDKALSSELHYLAMGLAAASIALAVWQRRSINWRRLGSALAVLAVGAVGGAFVAAGTEPFGDFAGRMAASLALLAGSACLGVALLTGDGVPLETPMLRPMVLLLGASAVVAYASCFTSMLPEDSFRDFAKHGMGIYLLLALLAAVAMRVQGGPAFLFRALALTGGAWLAASISLAIAGVLGGDGMRAALETRGVLRDLDPEGGAWAFKLQFPFDHHNRLAMYAVAVGFAGLVAWRMEARPRWRGLWIAVAVVAAGSLALSQTRGAYLAAGAGAAAWAAAGMHSRRDRMVAIVACVVLAAAFLLVPQVRERARTMVDPDSYTDSSSTAALRFNTWRAGFDIGLHRPLLGAGYGWRPFHLLYRENYQERFNDPLAEWHAHSDFLQAFAESGLLAGLLYVFIWGWAMHETWARRRSVPWAAALLGMMAALFVYGLTNHAMRFVAGSVGWMTLVAAAMAPSPGGEEQD